MRRKSSNDIDSLDLLLDTICNMFGGVIFIAVLVSLLTSSESAEVQRQQRETVERVVARREAREVASRIANYRLAVEELDRSERTLRADQAMGSRDLLDTLLRERQRAETRVQVSRAWIKRYGELQQEQAAELERRAQKAEDEVRHLENQLGDTREAHTIEARLPIERETKLKQLLFLVQGGRAYGIPLGSTAQIIERAMPGSVDITQLSDGWIVEPAAGGGVAVDAGLSDTGWVSLLATADPNEHFFHFFVAADSVSSYRTLRSAMSRRGFRYNLGMLPPGRPLGLTRAASVGVQ